MTHAAGFCAAAAVRTSGARSLGIDAEPAEPLPDGVLALVGSPAERNHLELLATVSQQIPWDRLLFSAKESVYKAWYPVMRSWLGFEDVRLHLEPTGGFRTELVSPDRGVSAVALVDAMRGRWCLASDYVVSAVLVPPDDQPDWRRPGAGGHSLL